VAVEAVGKSYGPTLRFVCFRYAAHPLVAGGRPGKL